jgi:hypothetical protein
MKPQTETRQATKGKTSRIMPQGGDYPEETIVNLRLPRKRVALLDIDLDLAALPRRSPHVLPEAEPEEVE